MNTWIISGIILAIGFLICLFLILRNKWKVRKKHIKDYEEGRDKLTPEVQKANEKIIESQEEGYSGGFSIGSIISGIVTILIGFSLIGPVSEQVKLATVSSATNSTLASTEFTSTVLNTIPILFALGVLIIAVSMAYNFTRDNGLA